jgi:hypothetical protein
MTHSMTRTFTTILMLSALPTLACAQASKTGYVAANAQGCQVWQPPQLHAPDFIPRYTGACKDGMASGKGHLEWINKFASMRVSATWDGYFHDGVYAGPKPFDHRIEPEDRSNEYLVHLGPVAGGDVIVFASNTRDGEMDLCGANMLGVSLNAKTPATDDAAVKQAMIDAAHSLGEYCATTPHLTVQVNAYAEPFKIDAHGTRTLQIADARLDWSTHQLSGYSNQASAAVRGQQRQSAQMAKLADERKRFDDFTRHNGITAWVTTTQLDTNPFKYEGRTVGIVVQLDRMVTRDTALVDGDADGGGTPVQLHGITPDFPDRSHAVLLAVKVGRREPLAGDKNTDAAFTSVAKLDSFVCTREDCDDLLEWQRGADRIHWGDPYTPSN